MNFLKKRNELKEIRRRSLWEAKDYIRLITMAKSYRSNSLISKNLAIIVRPN